MEIKSKSKKSEVEKTATYKIGKTTFKVTREFLYSNSTILQEVVSMLINSSDLEGGKADWKVTALFI